MKQTTLLPIDVLIPFTRNARTHSKEQITKIGQSIERFGFINPVLIDDKNTILAGHGRVEAARHLGVKEVPTLRIDHLSEAEKRAYVIADNRIAERAGWDKEALAIELQGLIDLDFDVALTGFEVPDVDLIVGEFSPNSQNDECNEKIPEKPAGPAVTLPGDVFLLGEHRLLCGDSLSPDCFKTLMQDEQAAVCFTDPLSDVKIGDRVSELRDSQHREFDTFLQQSLLLIAGACRAGAIAFVCMDWRYLAETIAAGKVALGEFLNLCVWNKSDAGMGNFYRSQHELVCVFQNGSEPRNNVEFGRHGRHRSDVWTYRGVSSKGLMAHPTVKPVALVADALLDVSRRGEIVLDPFGGSGTTLLAAHKTGRRARLIEIDPLYCELIVRRFEMQTGKQARHAETGETFQELSVRRRREGTTDRWSSQASVTASVVGGML